MYGWIPEGGGEVGFVWIRSSGPEWTARLGLCWELGSRFRILVHERPTAIACTMSATGHGIVRVASRWVLEYTSLCLSSSSSYVYSDPLWLRYLT